VLIFNTGILLHLGKKAAPFLDPGPPSGPARRGQARQAAPAYVQMGKAASQPRPGAPGFGEAFAILKPESAD